MFLLMQVALMDVLEEAVAANDPEKLLKALQKNDDDPQVPMQS